MTNLARYKTPRNDSKLLAPLPTQRKRGKRQGGFWSIHLLPFAPGFAAYAHDTPSGKKASGLLH